MNRKLYLLPVFALLAAALTFAPASSYAHCGACGVGDHKAKDHAHDKAEKKAKDYTDKAHKKAKDYTDKAEKKAKDHSHEHAAADHGHDHAEGVRHAHDFTLMDHNGEKVSLSDFEGKIVVLEWTNPDCPFVEMHYDKATTMVDTYKKHKSDQVVWLAINSTHYNKPEDSKKWAAERGVEYRVLQDADGKVGRMYEAKTTPHMFVIDAEGHIAYEGAIDNYMSKSDEKINYVDNALASLVAGKPVAVSFEKPYGCSVKYKQN
jgi:peroxiredoxin